MKNVVFFGTPKIGADILKTLLECDVNIVGVVCQPDKQANRGKISYSEVKTLALQNNLKLFQPNKLNEILNELTNLNIDLIVTCAYGLIVPESILNLPKYKCVNIHTSLLPKYRGAAPIQYALLNNDSTTGVTLMYMDKGMDTGDIIKQASVSIDKDETYKSLYNKLSDAGSTLIKNEINNLFSDNVIVKKQNNELATYTQKITREVEHIDWSNTSIEIDCKIRALYDKPLAYCVYDNIEIKILKATISNVNHNGKPGEILSINKNGILVKTNDGSLLITQIQLAGKKPIEVSNFINGNKFIKVGGFFE